MSEDEKFAIIGRLTVEKAEIGKQAAFVRQELESTIKALSNFLDSIRHRGNSVVKARPVEVPSGLEKYMDLTKLLSLIREQEQLTDRSEELRKQLAELGAL